jgi:hypothetical protein
MRRKQRGGLSQRVDRVLALLGLSLLVFTLAACGAPSPAAAPAAPAAGAPVDQTAAEAPKAAEPTIAAAPTEAPKANEPVERAVEKPVEVERATIAVPQATLAPVQPAAPAAAPAAPGDPVMPSGVDENSGSSAPAATAAPASAVEVAPLATEAPSVAAEQDAARAKAPETAVIADQPADPRVVELEFPGRIKLGDSDAVRVSLVPVAGGYTPVIEAPDNTVITSPVVIPQQIGYSTQVEAALSGVNFDIDQPRQRATVAPTQRLDFRWTVSPRQSGRQRLIVEVRALWTPLDAANPPLESQIFSKPLNVEVAAVFGMTSAQAGQAGAAGMAIGAGLGLVALFATPRGRKLRESLGLAEPNEQLALEPQASMRIDAGESRLLKTLFRKYSRVVLEREFRSGYSGARTFLALPVRADGRADAHTIAKIGDKRSIRREFENFEQFVKDTLPPITARIQEAPVAVARGAEDKAILRYTFIGEPGKLPVSLREALLANPDPAPIHKLFDTFGPNWWMQRKPHTFRLSEAYDRLLPAHYVVERVPNARSADGVLDGAMAPDNARFDFGDIVQLRNFADIEARADGGGYSLTGAPAPGQPPLRVRFLTPVSGAAPSEPLIGRVVGTRATLLKGFVAGKALYDLPDPLLKLPSVLAESVQGTESTIHGDLNLENVLIGLGGIVWLIDFALTCDGHPLMDFAHLEADVIAHVIAPQLAHPRDTLRLGEVAPQFDALRAGLRSVALRCLLNPSQPREYDLALYMACIGALKYNNLNAHQKHVLYLSAAQIANRL